MISKTFPCESRTSLSSSPKIAGAIEREIEPGSGSATDRSGSVRARLPDASRILAYRLHLELSRLARYLHQSRRSIMAPQDDSSGDIKHDPEEQVFTLSIDGENSELRYARSTGAMHFTHTYVPPSLRGRGIAERLTRHALDYARQEKLKVIPECSYVAKFLERHPELAR